MKMHNIPLLEIIEKTGIRHKASVNGFDTALLLSVRANQKKKVPGLNTALASYCALHPYFLKRHGNELRFEFAVDPSQLAPDDRGPWRLDCRVAAMEYPSGKKIGENFTENELLRLTSPSLSKSDESGKTQTLAGSFNWSEIPEWRWTKAEKIQNTPANQKSLEAAVAEFWNALNDMAGKPIPASFASSTRDSIREFIQASELGGKQFTLLRDLLEAASKLALPGDKSPEEFLREREQRHKGLGNQPAPDDEPAPHPPVLRDPAGKLPPRLSLRKLDSFGSLEMFLIADGRLARLSAPAGESIIQFVSNYYDGSRGAPGETRLQCDLWFRKNRQNAWELDAIYPTATAGLVLDSIWPQELFEQQPY